MIKIDENLFAVFDNRMFPLAGNIYDCTDTAGIVLAPNLI